MNTQSFLSIHKSVVAIVVIAFALLCSACSNDNENVQRFKDAALSLDNTENTLNVFDYWPECGLRVMGSHLASLISLEELEKMLPCPLYVSGPHRNGQWDLENDDDYGHYNPEAIQYLADLAKKVVADKKFIEASKPLVDQYLYDKMLIMMVLQDALHDDGLPGLMYYDGSVQQVREDILNEFVDGGGFCEDISCYFRDKIYIDVPSWNENSSNEYFLLWWVRRWDDGTMDLFYDALSTVFKAYHPEYEFHLEDYVWESEEDDVWEEDW